MHIVFWWGNLWERDHFEDTGIDGKAILKWTLKKENGGVDSNCLSQDMDRWRTLVNAVMDFQVV
jgi:hypothetical protein